ncbi:acyl carrier protein [Mesorhizobium sp. KR9-304]|uniref:acyl carrier protein n=1 Tax=Mesorhizobium sp. KR9-304 TaxID=3156614 RepID=UPI0032B616D7
MPEAAELKARKTISDALKCSLDAVGPDADVQTLPQWDSIGHINIILEIETELGRKLLPEEIAGISSVADVARLYMHQPASA